MTQSIEERAVPISVTPPAMAPGVFEITPDVPLHATTPAIAPEGEIKVISDSSPAITQSPITDDAPVTTPSTEVKTSIAITSSSSSNMTDVQTMPESSPEPELSSEKEGQRQSLAPATIDSTLKQEAPQTEQTSQNDDDQNPVEVQVFKAQPVPNLVNDTEGTGQVSTAREASQQVLEPPSSPDNSEDKGISVSSIETGTLPANVADVHLEGIKTGRTHFFLASDYDYSTEILIKGIKSYNQ